MKVAAGGDDDRPAGHRLGGAHCDHHVGAVVVVGELFKSEVAEERSIRSGRRLEVGREPSSRPGRATGLTSDRLAAGVRGIEREGPAVGSADNERIVDAAAADRRRRQPLVGVVAVRGVDHQVEGRCRAGGCSAAIRRHACRRAVQAPPARRASRSGAGRPFRARTMPSEASDGYRDIAFLKKS